MLVPGVDCAECRLCESITSVAGGWGRLGVGAGALLPHARAGKSQERNMHTTLIDLLVQLLFVMDRYDTMTKPFFFFLLQSLNERYFTSLNYLLLNRTLMLFFLHVGVLDVFSAEPTWS